MEGFLGGAFAACESGGLEESPLAPWRVFRVHFRGIGLGRHEDSVCPLVIDVEGGDGICGVRVAFVGGEGVQGGGDDVVALPLQDNVALCAEVLW